MKKLTAALFAIAIALVPAAAAPSVVVLRSSASLYAATDGENVKWAADITAGTVLSAAADDSVTKNIVTSSRTWNDVPFYAVTYEQKPYFIQVRDSAPVARADDVGIITRNAVLFTRPHLATFRNAWLEPGTVVALSGGVEGKAFREVTFFDTDDGVRRTRFVWEDSFSLDAKDRKAVQLLEKARTLTDEALRQEFLDNAAQAAASDSLAEHIRSETNRILGVSSFSDDDIVQMETVYATVFTRDGAAVNLRALPGTAGEKVAQLVPGTAVALSLKTEPTETIEGITDSWYYVTVLSAPDAGDGADDAIAADDAAAAAEGWLFGGYLSTGEAGAAAGEGAE